MSSPRRNASISVSSSAMREDPEFDLRIVGRNQHVAAADERADFRPSAVLIGMF
jgi:hypothetical protein